MFTSDKHLDGIRIVFVVWFPNKGRRDLTSLSAITKDLDYGVRYLP